MPPSPCTTRRAEREDPYLDDERLLARLEARLDQEGGADALNIQTFGAGSGGGWSFEEAVKANEKLRIDSDVSDWTQECTTATGSFCEAASLDPSLEAEISEQGDADSDASEDRRRRRRRRDA